MTLNTTWLWISAGAALVNWCVHLFVGGPRIVPPLMQSDLPSMPKQVLYFVWHLATIVLLSLPICFALAATYPLAWPLAVYATVLCGLIGLMILWVSVSRRIAFRDMPQWTLFLALAVLGATSIWLG